MRLVIVSDAWRPQVNGVVRTLEALSAELRAMGHSVRMITPDLFTNVPCPTYPEIRLAIARPSVVARMIENEAPDFIHLATEGPLGIVARRYCIKRRLIFTTSFHTRFPEYVHARCRLPIGVSYAAIRWFHRPAKVTMVATETLRKELTGRGFTGLGLWGRGVDTNQFHPGPKGLLKGPGPSMLYVGRVAVEKNVEAFLSLDLPGTMHVVGDGPQVDRLKRDYPKVVFHGAKYSDDLAAYYAAADVFVFPSLTDTFGNVLLEALACGVPVAAFPVPGPIDVIDDPAVGALDPDLGKAIEKALPLSSDACRRFAEAHSWRESANQFMDNLMSLNTA